LHSILEVKVISRKQEIGSDQFSSFLFFVHLGSHEKVCASFINSGFITALCILRFQSQQHKLYFQ